jgi:hypothetical protein
MMTILSQEPPCGILKSENGDFTRMMDANKLMNLEVRILHTSDYLDRKVAVVAAAVEDKAPIPGDIIPQIQGDIATLRSALDDLEHELTT